MIKRTIIAAAALMLAFGVSTAEAGGRWSGHHGGYHGGYRGGYHGYYGGHHHYNPGAAFALGVTGAFLGAAIAAPYYYAPPVTYYPAPVYGAPYYGGYYRPYYRYGYRW